VTKRIKQPEHFDVIGDILETLRFRGTIFFHSDLAAPWGMSLGEVKAPRFHIMLSGDCYLGSGTDEVVKVNDMEIAMLPTGNAHWIADQPGRDLVESLLAGAACELNSPLFQEGTITNRLMCGIVSYDQNISHPILESFPTILHFPHDNIEQSAWATAALIDSEVQRRKSNVGPIIDRLTEVLFLQLLQEYLGRNDIEIGFFAALRDQRLAYALELIHSQPQNNWSVAELGTSIGMSRATLNRHFLNTIGVTPILYIQNWKLVKAYSLVKYSNLSIDAVAEQLGFASARTLTKPFQKHHGLTPTQLRRSP
jgi:AraC-like DNA-binding protein